MSAAAQPGGAVKVVAVLGCDAVHHGLGYELALREIFASRSSWRIHYVRAARAFTPALIEDARLLIACRGPEPDPADLSSAGQAVAVALTPGAPFWTPANVEAVAGHVRGRGMGLLALHDTIYCGAAEILALLDAAPIPPREIQPVWVKDLDAGHPITAGAGKFHLKLDEPCGAVIKSADTVTLFRTTAIHDKRQAVGGWCRQAGKGRVVCLLPGHTVTAYEAPEYRNLLWRAAHWAMAAEIPPYGGAKNTLYQIPRAD
jgi:hypothetical protein